MILLADANSGQWMRREDEGHSSPVQIESAGNVEIHAHHSLQVEGNGALAETSEASLHRESGAGGLEEKTAGALQDVAETPCDRDWHVMVTDSCTGGEDGCDACTVGALSWNPKDCEDAADSKSGPLPYNMSDDWMLNISEVNPILHPKGCFLDTSSTPWKIKYNPSESSIDGLTITGRKICMRQLYVNGTANTDSPAACTGAGAGYVPILDYDACWDAMTCHKGDRAPKLDAFRLNTTNWSPANRPRGCFVKTSTGEWGFNWIHRTGGEVDSSLPDSSAICRDSTAT